MRKSEQDFFEWDEFFKNAKFEDVMDLQFLPRNRWISCFSPCRRWFFLSSQDLDIDMQNIDAGQVRNLLESIKESIESKVQIYRTDSNCLGAMRITSLLIDKFFLEDLLNDLKEKEFYV